MSWFCSSRISEFCTSHISEFCTSHIMSWFCTSHISEMALHTRCSCCGDANLVSKGQTLPLALEQGFLAADPRQGLHPAAVEPPSQRWGTPIPTGQAGP